MHVTVAAEAGPNDVKMIGEIRAIILKTNRFLGKRWCRADFSKPVGNYHFQGSTFSCHGGRTRYSRRPSVFSASGPMKIFPILNVIRRAANKEFYREGPIMPAILLVIGTKYACNLHRNGDQILSLIHI